MRGKKGPKIAQPATSKFYSKRGKYIGEDWPIDGRRTSCDRRINIYNLFETPAIQCRISTQGVKPVDNDVRPTQKGSVIQVKKTSIALHTCKFKMRPLINELLNTFTVFLDDLYHFPDNKHHKRHHKQKNQ